ncbi:MAG: peptidoglycan DD-metalloendopeptidase family protein [Chlorobium sp.]
MSIMSAQYHPETVRRFRRIFFFLLFFLPFVVSSVPVLSSPVTNNEIRQIKKERQAIEATLKKLQKELRTYQSKLNATASKEKRSLATLENIRRQILVTEKLIAENQSYLSELDDDIDSLGSEIGANRKKHARLTGDFRRTAISVYKYGRNREAEHLFSSGSVNEALARAQYIGFFSRAVSGNVEKLRKNAAELENNQATLKKRFRQKAAVLKEQEQHLESYARTRKEKELALVKLKKDKQQYAAQLDTAKKQRQQIQSKIQNLVLAEQKAVAAEEARQQRLLEERRKAEAERLEAERLEQQKLAAGTVTQTPSASSAPKTPASAAKTAPKQYASKQTPTVVPDYSSRDIERVSADFNKAYGALPWPVRGGVVSRKFGTTEDSDLKIVSTNNGIDISVPVGTPVRAVSGGKVVQIAYLPTFGNIVIVRHPDSFLTVYANLGSLNVTKNDIIKSQQLIGVSGKMPEGGSVVHFEIWKGTVKQNPERWLRR